MNAPCTILSGVTLKSCSLGKTSFLRTRTCLITVPDGIYLLRVHRYGPMSVTDFSNFNSTSALAGKRRVSALVLDCIRTIATQALCALYELHRSDVIHADLKPENCFLNVRHIPLTPLGGTAFSSPYGSRTVTSQRAGSSEMHPLEEYLYSKISDTRQARPEQQRYTPAVEMGCDIRELEVKFGLADFGNSIHSQELPEYFSDYEIQTLTYRAPECLLGLSTNRDSCVNQVDAPLMGTMMDMWSLGVLLMELCVGTTIFDGVKSSIRTDSAGNGARKQQLGILSELLGPLDTALFGDGKFGALLSDSSVRFPAKESKGDERVNGSDLGISLLDSRHMLSHQSTTTAPEHKNEYGTVSSTNRLRICNDRSSLTRNVHSVMTRYYDGYPPTLVDFISGLLQYDPRNRLTAHEALSHPFIAGTSFGSSKPSACSFLQTQAPGPLLSSHHSSGDISTRGKIQEESVSELRSTVRHPAEIPLHPSRSRCARTGTPVKSEKGNSGSAVTAPCRNSSRSSRNFNDLYASCLLPDCRDKFATRHTEHSAQDMLLDDSIRGTSMTTLHDDIHMIEDSDDDEMRSSPTRLLPKESNFQHNLKKRKSESDYNHDRQQKHVNSLAALATASSREYRRHASKASTSGANVNTPTLVKGEIASREIELLKSVPRRSFAQDNSNSTNSLLAVFGEVQSTERSKKATPTAKKG
jgi:serine/threonine protein kinase